MLVLTDVNFKKEALGAGAVVVLFTAAWCGPCKQQARVLEKMESEQAKVPRARFCKLDVENSPALVESYGIRGVPTLAIFNNGKMVSKSTGMISETTLTEMLEDLV